MASNNKFFSLSNRPKTKSAPAGKHVYEWDYLDSTGALKHDKKNVYEEIQSYLNSTDYKRLIKDGDIDGFGCNDRDLYMDTTELPGNFVDACKHITDCSAYFDEVVEKLKNSRTGENIGQTAENERKGAEIGRQGDGVVEQSKQSNKQGGDEK